jgi:carbon-monoxide dehydrogenase small subunit
VLARLQEKKEKKKLPGASLPGKYATADRSMMRKPTCGEETVSRIARQKSGVMATNKLAIQMTVNAVTHAVQAWPMARLLDVLREELRLTGTKEGCGEGECGACAVLLDGALVNSCLVPVAQAANADIVTIEGVADGDKLHAVQQAFIECGGAQCGICTPGMVLAAVALLRDYPQPTMADIRNGLAGNLCRCTGYMKIFESVVKACQA